MDNIDVTVNNKPKAVVASAVSVTEPFGRKSGNLLGVADTISSSSSDKIPSKKENRTSSGKLYSGC